MLIRDRGFEFAFLSQVKPVLSHLQKLGSRVRVSAFDDGFNALGCGNETTLRFQPWSFLIFAAIVGFRSL
jgi:hypothetical protein